MTSYRTLVFVCSVASFCLTDARSIGQTLAEARQSVYNMADRVPEYMSAAAEKLPEYMGKVPQYIERVPQYIEKVPQYMERVPQYIQRVPQFVSNVPQYVTGAVERVPNFLAGATTSIPIFLQNSMRSAVHDVSTLGSKISKILGLKSKKSHSSHHATAPASPYTVIQSPGYAGAPTYTVPMVSTDYKFKDGLKSVKSERPIASPPDTHAAAHAVTYGASAPPSYTSSGVLHHSGKLPQENEVPDLPYYRAFKEGRH